MGQYVLSVICTAFISGILLSLVQGSTARGVVKLLCGAVLAVTVVSPLSKLDVEAFFPRSDTIDAGKVTDAGEVMAREAMAGIIKERCESYILDKAAPGLRVDITVSGVPTPLPTAAKITGRASPDAKRKIEKLLQNDLGIPKERIQWTS